jgi:phage head maturation protease
MSKVISKAEGNFEFTFYIEKAIAEKEGGKLFVQGVASTMNVDHDSERMSGSALKQMATIINTKTVPLRIEHQKSDDAIVGDVNKAWIDDRGQLWIKAELDPENPMSKILHDSLQKGVKLGLSVGGRVKKAFRELAEGAGKMVKTFYDVVLDEVSVTQ